MKTSKRSSALEQMRALRESGGKRSEQYNIKEQESVYDEVTEKDYQEIVTERRNANDFVVDDGMCNTTRTQS